MSEIKCIVTNYTHNDEKIKEMDKISRLLSPKLISIIYKSFGVDYLVSQEELEYINNYPFLNVNEIIVKFGIIKGQTRAFNTIPNFLKDFIIRSYKKQDRKIEKILNNEGLGIRNVKAGNYKEIIEKRNIRIKEILDKLDEKFFTSLQQISDGIADNVAGLLLNK